MLNCTVKSTGCAGQMGLVGGVLGDVVENAGCGCDGPVAVERRAPAGDDHVVC